jgi:uncharacterized BrkB/YihY/UPF0761 family membrane protein
MLHGIGVLELGERSVRNFFEHRMTTYAAALAYRGLFGLFPFVLILVVLASAMGLSSQTMASRTGAWARSWDCSPICISQPRSCCLALG